MVSERVQRQISRLLDEAEQAVADRDWPLAREHCEYVLRLDPQNADAAAFLSVAELGLEKTRESPLPPGSRGGAPSRRVGGGHSSNTTGEGQGEGRPRRRHHPQEPPAGTGETPALPGLRPVPASFVGGRYAVKKFLGEGGKKRVYLAHDTLLDRDVAFALIKTEGLDDVGRDRVTREAQAMGRLGAHPHIVSVFDMGEEGDQPYIVTELMGGGDVEALIAKAPQHKLPLAQALTLAEQVCRGLELAHAQGIVHRDLKPGNVWLTEATGNGQRGLALPSPWRKGLPKAPDSAPAPRPSQQRVRVRAKPEYQQTPEGRTTASPRSATSAWRSRWTALA